MGDGDEIGVLVGPADQLQAERKTFIREDRQRHARRAEQGAGNRDRGVTGPAKADGCCTSGGEHDEGVEAASAPGSAPADLGAKRELDVAQSMSDKGLMSNVEVIRLRRQVNDLELQAQERINRTIAEETGQPFSKVVEDTDRNYWMSAEEAKAYGLVSRIIERIDLA